MPLLKSKPVTHKYPFVVRHQQRSPPGPETQVWSADDPVVTEHEGTGLFSDDPPLLCRTTKPETLGELYGR
jgi:hypothetical protein